MTIEVSTTLDAAADEVWQLIKKPSTFRFVVRGVVGVSSSFQFPDQWRVADGFRFRLWLFHCLPAGKHTIHIESIDEAIRTIRTREHGGILRKWNHTLHVEALASGCRYSDQVEVEAVIGTRVVAQMARLLFWYRQRRLRRLVGQT